MDTTAVHREIDLLRAVIDNLAGGVIVADTDGRFLLFNSAAEKILGVGAPALDPAKWTETYGCYLPDAVTPCPPDQLPLARVLKGEEIVDDRLYIRNPRQANGVWLSVDGKPFKENRGAIWGGMVVLHDISENIQSEQSLHSTSSTLSALIDSHEAAILVENEKRLVVQVNQAFCDLFDIPISPAEYLGTDCTTSAEQVKNLFADPRGFVDGIEELLRNRSTVMNEKLHLADGRMMERDFIPVFIDKEYRGQVWQYRDVTRREQVRQRFRVYERLCTALEQTADSVVITDRKGIIEYVNPAFETITGYGRDEVLGKTPQILKSGKHDAEFYLTLWSEVLAGRPFKGTIVNKKKSGDLYWSQQTITPVKNTEGNITHFISVMKDITELLKQKEQEASLRVAREVQQRFYRARVSAPGFDVAGAAVTADETGGDYFDFITLPNGALCIAIGDVSGHGVGAALVMAETRAYLRSFAASCEDIAELLGRVNRALAADLLSDRFVTLLLCCLDPGAGTLTYASAGHEPGYVLNESGEILTVMKATGPPLGLSGGTTYRPGSQSRLAPGHMLLLVTDGITDAVSPDEALYGEARAIEYVRAHRQQPSSAIVNGLCGAIEVFVGDRSLQDDIAAVVIKAM